MQRPAARRTNGAVVPRNRGQGVNRQPPPPLDTRADRVSRIRLRRVRIVVTVGDGVQVRAGLAGDGVGGRGNWEGDGEAQDCRRRLKKGHTLIGRGGGNM